MAEGADWKISSAWTRVGGIKVPAESASHFGFGRGLDGVRQLNGLRLEESHAVQFTIIQKTTRVSSEIRGGGEKSCVPCHSAHAPRGWIMHGAAKNFVVEFLSGCNARNQGSGRKKHCIAHL